MVPITALVLLDLRMWVLGVYVLAALTDAFDGMFARHASQVERRPDFDGLADVFFAIVTLLWIQLLFPAFFVEYWFPYLPLLIATQGYLLLVRRLRPEIVLPHFEFGRFAVFLFNTLLPVLLVVGVVEWFVWLVFTVSIAAKLQLIWHVYASGPSRPVAS